MFSFFAQLVNADEIEDRRVRISMEIFPRIVAVDQDIRDKLSEKDAVRLFIVYDRDMEAAQRIADNMKNSITNIGGRAVEFVVQSAEQALARGLDRPSAVFLAEKFNGKIFSAFLIVVIDQRILMFSPFAGDVERGATAGLSISSRIKPYFNVPTLNQSHISINEKLLSISQRYE